MCGGERLRDSISHILTDVWTSGGHHITHCLIHHCWSPGLGNSTAWRKGEMCTLTESENKTVAVIMYSASFLKIINRILVFCNAIYDIHIQTNFHFYGFSQYYFLLKNPYYYGDATSSYWCKTLHLESTLHQSWFHC